MRTIARPLLVLGALSMLGTACTGDDDDSDTTPTTDEASDDGDDGQVEPDDEPSGGDELDGEGLTLGFIRAPVGLFGVLGSAQAGGLALAVDDIAAGGGVLGGPLQIVEEQPAPDREVGAVFDELVGNDIHLIVGPSSSEEALALLPQLPSSDAVLCGASTTAPGLPATAEAEGRFVRTTFDDDIVAVNAFDRIRQQTASILGRAPKVTIVARGDAYGDSVSGSLAPLLTVVGMEVSVLRYGPNNVMLDDFAVDVAATEPDVAVVVSLDEGARLVRLIIDAGVPAPNVLGLDGIATPRFVGKANIDDTEPYQRLSIVGATGPVSFLTRVLERQESDGEVIYAAQAYDCAIAFALAVEAAGSTDASDVSDALRSVTGGGTICTTYGDCLELLRAGEDIDYDGPSGPVDFTEAGEPGGGRFITARLIGDQLNVVADLRITLDEIRSLVAPRIAGFIGDIQVALTELGYYDGPIDGVQSEAFNDAVAAFQTDNGLEPTGDLDAATIAAIQEALAERGLLLSASIRDVQQLLTDLGYYTGPIDGVFSPELSDAIAAFQTDLGVAPTGILDAATLRAIYQAGLTAGQETPPTTTVPGTTVPPTTAPPTTAPESTTTTVAPTTTTATTTPPTTVPALSVYETLQANDQFSELVALLDLPGLEDVRDALSDPAATITLFAPNNDALADDLPSAPVDDIVRTLQAHVVAETIDPLEADTFDTALTGATVTIDPTITPPSVSNTDSSVAANVVGESLPSGDGVIWEIDAVLTPPAP